MNNEKLPLLRKLPIMLALVWFFAILFVFIIFQAQTVKLEFIQVVSNHLINIGAVFLTLVAAAAIGYGLVNFIIDENIHGLIAPLVGIILLSLLVLAAGLLGWFPPRWAAWAALLVICVLLYKNILRWLRWWKTQWKTFWAPLPSVWFATGRMMVVIMLVIAFLMALAPPTQWDALMYHLSAGQYYLQHDGIVVSLDNYRYSNPNLMMMVFLWLQILAGGESGAILMWFMGILLIISVRAFCDFVIKGDYKQIWWNASFIILTMNGVWITFTRAYADAAVITFYILALALIFHYTSSNDLRILVLAGIFSGCLLGMKYTTIAFPIALCLLLIYLERHKRKKMILEIFIFSAAVTAAFLPWMLKNYLVDGNPVSPYVWGSPAFEDKDQLNWSADSTGLWWMNGLLLPLQASVFGTEGNDPFQGMVGAFVVASFPLLVFTKPWKRELNPNLFFGILICCLPPYLMWVFGSLLSQNLAIVRFYYPMFICLALLGSMAMVDMPTIASGFPIRKFVQVGLGMSFLFSFLLSTIQTVELNPLPVIFGVESRDEFLTRHLGGLYTFSRELHTLAVTDPAAKAMLLWEPRTYYCNPYCWGDDNLTNWQEALITYGNPDAVAAGWIEQGYTHVLAYEIGAEFLSQSQNGQLSFLSTKDFDVYEQFKQDDLELISIEGGHAFYKIITP